MALAQAVLEPQVIFRGKKEVLPTEELLRQVDAEGCAKLRGEIQELRRELETFNDLRADKSRGLATALVQAWRGPGPAASGAFHVDDPVCKQLTVDPELAPLLAHPLLQRLNHIKQLSFAYLAFPSATHTRLSHVLGVSRHVELALDAVFRKNALYSAERRTPEPIGMSSEERRRLTVKAKAAALLHDVGHGPFGHALDRFIGFIDPQRPIPHPDKHYSCEYVRRYLGAALPPGLTKEELIGVLGKRREGLRGWDSFLADLIDSSLDVDRMDYLTRDAHMSGLSMGVINAEALIERMCPFRDGDAIVLTYDGSSLPYIEDFLRARDLMFRNCYDHPRKVAAERIFTRLVEGLIRDHGLEIEVVMMLADEQILALLSVAATGSQTNSNLLGALLHNIEYERIHEVPLDRDNPDVRAWNAHRAEGFTKQAYIDSPSSWERALAEQSGLGGQRSWQVLVVVPAHETSSPVETGARVLFKREGGFCTQELFAVLPTLKEHLKDLTSVRQKIRVFCDGRLTFGEKRALAEATERLFGER